MIAVFSAGIFKQWGGGGRSQEPNRNRVVVPARQATYVGWIDSLELILGLLKSFKIRAQWNYFDCCVHRGNYFLLSSIFHQLIYTHSQIKIVLWLFYPTARPCFVLVHPVMNQVHSFRTHVVFDWEKPKVYALVTLLQLSQASSDLGWPKMLPPKCVTVKNL
jgi:hypothetical protein